MNLESNTQHLKQEDIRSLEGMKKYFIREGKRFYNEEGDKGLKIFVLFLIEEQKFVREKKDIEDILYNVFKECKCVE